MSFPKRSALMAIAEWMSIPTRNSFAAWSICITTQVNSTAMPLLERVTAYAAQTFDRTRQPAAPKPWEMHSGKPLEWYTQPENLYRAYQLSGNKRFKEFAEVWLYDSYWNKFANTSSPKRCQRRPCL